MTFIHDGNRWTPKKIPPEDIPVLIECFKEHDRLIAEAKKLSDKELAKKWEVSHQRINYLRIKFFGRNR